MEDLWKLRDISYRLKDVADRAEYNQMLKRFREQEERENRANLLYGEASFRRPPVEKSK